MSRRPRTSRGGREGGGAGQPRDALVKRLLGPPAEAAGYLASVLPPPLAARVDSSTLVACEGPFVDRELARHGTDLLYEARVDGRAAPM